jgi:hypothetical protein
MGRRRPIVPAKSCQYTSESSGDGRRGHPDLLVHRRPRLLLNVLATALLVVSIDVAGYVWSYARPAGCATWLGT